MSADRGQAPSEESDGTSAEVSGAAPSAGYPPRLILSTALAIAWLTLPALAGFYLIARIGAVNEWLAARGDAGLWVFGGLFALASGFGLLPTYACAVLGGWAFGFGNGIAAALAGFLGGATIGFAISRLVGGDAIRQRIDRHPRAGLYRSVFVERGFARTLGVVALLRMPPNSPFALTNLAMAGAGVRYLPFALGTAAGMLPRTAVMVAVGAAGRASGAADLQSVAQNKGVWFLITAVIASIAVLAILGAVGSAAVRRLEASSRAGGAPRSLRDGEPSASPRS
ncbi:MAG TPA: VTT domain-containing protein [Phycisphaerales bacterium]|nr:VTT domain-containing protein [Phycisphaerales bacterium]HMP37116.1 VTT domain-containing protein [Phycisphaerales bacterium]